MVDRKIIDGVQKSQLCLLKAKRIFISPTPDGPRRIDPSHPFHHWVNVSIVAA
jgi:hypothetical protein